MEYIHITSRIKESTQQNRGKGVRRKFAGKTKLPGNSANLLPYPTNKQELFAFLSNKISTVDCPEDKESITSGTTSIIKGTNRPIAPCDHEEADTRLLIHIIDALLNDCTSCLVRSVDTDVIAILIGNFIYLLLLFQEVAFGKGKNFTYHHINSIYEDLGKDKSLALPIFHSFTGCDTTSAFFGRSKKSACEPRNIYPDMTFTYMALQPYIEVKVDTENFQLLKWFTVILYYKASDL